MSFRWRLALIALAALVLRVVYALTVAGDANFPGRGGDRFFFVAGAKLLADGHGFVHPFIWYATHRDGASAGHPPLWIAVLAPLAKLGGLTFTSARVVGAVVGAAAVVPIGFLGRRLAGDWAGLLAAGIAATYPAWIVGDASGMSEALYLLLVAGALLAALDRRAILAGVLVALAALTRTEAVLLLPVVLWPLLWGRRAAVATVAAIVVIAPWTIRNAVELHRFVPISTNDATVLAGANCPQTYHGRDLGYWEPACFHRATTGVDLRNYDEGALAAGWERQGLRYARDHASRLPAVVAVRMLRTWRLWQPLRAPVSEGEGATADKVAALWFLILLLPLGLLGLIRAPLAREHRRALVGLCVVVTLTSAIGWGSPRFLRPAELALMVAAAAYIAAHVRGRFRARQAAGDTRDTRERGIAACPRAP